MKNLLELHAWFHKHTHPFEHIAHGGLFVIIISLIKFVVEALLVITLHLSAVVLLGGFAGTAVTSLLVERKFLKKELKRLEKKV